MVSSLFLCSRCNGKNLTQDDFDINEQGTRLKTCNKCRENQKQKRDENRDNINKQAREHYKTIREEKIEQTKQYRNDNKEKLHEIQKCECGGKYIYRGTCQHVKSKKHLDYIERLNQ